MNAKAASPRDTERRTDARTPVLWVATMAAAGAEVDCVVLNMSEGGAMVRVMAPFDPAGPATLAIPSYILRRDGDIPCEAVWRDDDTLGVRFLTA